MLKSNKLKLFYFSGTGNSRNLCYWIKDEYDKHNENAEVINIAKLEKRDIDQIEKDTTIGFVSPTHGFNFPPIMFHYILRFPRGKNKVIILNTRAGMKLGKIFLPGLSGVTQLFSALVLIFKGYKIQAMKPVDLPSNWISLHPGLKQKVVDSIYAKREIEVRHFAQALLVGKKNYRALYDLIQDLLLSPISIGYYLFGRFVFAKTFVASSDCTKCKLCMNQCPVKAIKWIDDRPFWSYKCESCMQCMNICPARSIETAHGFIFLFAIIVDSLILTYFYSFIDVMGFLTGVLPYFVARGIQIILSTGIMFALLIPSYRIMHFLMRYKVFERIIIYSSLSKYKFWRRYKIRKSKVCTSG